MDIKDAEPLRNYSRTRISRGYVELWKDNITPEEMKILMPHIEDMHKRLGYV